MNSDVSKIRWFYVRWEFYSYAFPGFFFMIVAMVISFFQEPEQLVLYTRWMGLFSLIFLSAIGVFQALRLYWKIGQKLKDAEKQNIKP